MIRTYCPTCKNEVRISGGGTTMEWDVDGKTQTSHGDFHKSWVCPFCHPEPYKQLLIQSEKG